MTNSNQTLHPENLGASNIISLNTGGGSPGLAGSVLPEIVQEETGGLPTGFLLREEGIYHLRPSDGGDEIPVRLCSPITVIGLCSRSDGSCWGRVVDVQDPDGKVHRLVIDEKEFSGSPARLLRPLLDKGLEVEAVEKAAHGIAALLHAWRPRTRFTRADLLGWTDARFQAFALGDGRVIGDDLIVFQHQASDAAKAMHASSSLEDWRETVAAPCVGNPLMILAVSLAFTGPLLWPLSMDGGGFHLRGASSRGKTTLLGVAASVWGAPSFVQSWRGTDNGIEGIASACSGTLLALDELHQVSPRIAGEIVYMLANGRGKHRMQTNGHTQPVGRWHVPLLSSGEISLEEHMASGSKQIHAGQDIRLLDISADARRIGAFDCLHSASEGRIFSEQMQRAVQMNYGTAGPAFIKILMPQLAHRYRFQLFIDRFCEAAKIKFDLPDDGQVLRALRRFAVTALAGELASTFLVTGWARGIASAAILDVFGTWFEERESATRSDIDSAVTRTRDYIVKNVDRFAEIGTTGSVASSGWRDGSWFYILPGTWKTIHGDDENVDAARHHRDAGMLRTQKGSSLQYRMGRKVLDRPKVYAVSESILNPV